MKRKKAVACSCTCTGYPRKSGGNWKAVAERQTRLISNRPKNSSSPRRRCETSPREENIVERLPGCFRNACGTVALSWRADWTSLYVVVGRPYLAAFLAKSTDPRPRIANAIPKIQYRLS
jgi:hypothetical protein